MKTQITGRSRMDKGELLKKGNWIVHAFYGVGQIQGLEKKRLEGKDVFYYRVENEESTFWIPVQQVMTDRIRPVASESKLQEAIEALEERPQKMGNHKERQLRIKEIRSQGLLLPTACLVRDLSYGDATKKLSFSEHDVLDELKKRLIMEWSVVLGISPGEARRQLNKKLPQA